MTKDVVIIGAGASGLMCAIEAGKRGRSVVVLEHNDEAAKKIRISGGGRCNFTNLYTSYDNYISNNPHFFKSALSRYSPGDFCDLVEKHSIPYHEKTLGQLFCDDSAQNIIDLLLNECKTYNVEILVNTRAEKVIGNQPFEIVTNQGNFKCESLVLATGGLSIPPIGISDFGYYVAEQFGLNIIPCRPGLVPILWNALNKEIFASLSGISIDVEVSCHNNSFKESMLFTHKGLSGPAILQISSYCQPGDIISINLFPNENIEEILKQNHRNKIYLKQFLQNKLPKRLVEKLVDHIIPNKRLPSYTEKELIEVAKKLQQWEVTFSETEGYAKAEVTVGGVDTKEISSKTMESNKVKGLYFIGEVVDVTGQLGGFNFQWAWGSGFAAGQVV